MRTFFVQNPEIPTSYTMVSPHTRKVYEFGQLPVPVGDALDIQRCRTETVNGRRRLIETDQMGKPLASNPAYGSAEQAPLSYDVYRPGGVSMPPPQAASETIGRNAARPQETPYTRESGMAPSEGFAPLTATQGRTNIPVDDEDLGESEILRRRAAQGRKTRQ